MLSFASLYLSRIHLPALPSLKPVLLADSLAAFFSLRFGTMRALTPDPLRREDQVSPLTPLCFPNIPPPTTPCARTSLYQSPQRVRQIPGFAMYEQARRHMPPNRVR